MSYVYKCTRCNAVIGEEMTINPHCNTCRIEEAMSGLFSGLASRSGNYSAQDEVRNILTRLRNSGLPH